MAASGSDSIQMRVQVVERLPHLTTIDRLRLLQIVVGRRELASLAPDVDQSAREAVRSAGFIVLERPQADGRHLVCVSGVVADYVRRRGTALTALEASVLSGAPRTVSLAVAGITPLERRPYGRPSVAEYWLVSHYSAGHRDEERAFYESQWEELTRASREILRGATSDYDAFIAGWPGDDAA